MHAVFILMMFWMVFSRFMKEMEWLKKPKTEDLVKELDELAQKLDMIAAVIFTLIKATTAMLFLL